MDDTYNIRKGLAELVDAIYEEDSEEPKSTEIQMTANDITGSLGVWGISH